MSKYVLLELLRRKRECFPSVIRVNFTLSFSLIRSVCHVYEKLPTRVEMLHIRETLVDPVRSQSTLYKKRIKEKIP